MPVINIVLADDDHKKLQEEYEQMLGAWPQLGEVSAPPPFEHWAGSRMLSAMPVSTTEVSDIRLFSAVEKLITSLHIHGFGLAHLAENQTASASSLELAGLIVHGFHLPPHYLKKMQDVLEYYQKGAKEIAEIGQIGITSQAASTLHVAYQELVERTANALEELGPERAIGRAEGAVALLVSLHVMDRKTAQEKINAFKLRMRSVKKAGWVGKVLKGPKGPATER